jgi:cytochrome c-type biogenesis protein CcmF
VRHLVAPTVAALVSIPLLALVGVREWPVFIGLGLVVFVLVGHFMEIWRGWQAQRLRGTHGSAGSFIALFEKNRRRYGGYIIHLGVTVMALGIIISSFYRTETDRTVERGEPFTFGAYTMIYQGLEVQRDLVKERTAAPLQVLDQAGQQIAYIRPAIDLHFKVPGGQRETEVAIKHFPTEDLYVVLTGINADGTVTYKVFIEPLIGFVWLGGLILIFGSIVVVWPDPREQRILERVRSRETVVGSLTAAD